MHYRFKKFFAFIPAFYLLFFLLDVVFVLAQFEPPEISIPPPPVPGQPVTLLEIVDIVFFIGNFFIFIGPVLAVITVIISGLMYMTAGGDSGKLDKAKTWFKNGIIGSLIVLGVGVIMNTVFSIVTRDFFCKFDIPLGPFGRLCIWK